MNGRSTVVRNVGEFVVLLAVVLGGAVVATTVAGQFASPTSELVRGLAIGGLAVVGIAWLRVIGSEEQWDSGQGYAGLGGAVGALAASTFLRDSILVAIGAGIGAATFTAAYLALPGGEQ